VFKNKVWQMMCGANHHATHFAIKRKCIGVTNVFFSWCFLSSHFLHDRKNNYGPQLDRVLSLLLSLLALTEPISALSAELAGLEPGRTLVVHPLLGARVSGPTTLRASGLGRALRDRWRVARKAEAWLGKASPQGETRTSSPSPAPTTPPPRALETYERLVFERWVYAPRKISQPQSFSASSAAYCKAFITPRTLTSPLSCIYKKICPPLRRRARRRSCGTTHPPSRLRTGAGS
jgi:hypothetical protein